MRTSATAYYLDSLKLKREGGRNEWVGLEQSLGSPGALRLVLALLLKAGSLDLPRAKQITESRKRALVFSEHPCGICSFPSVFDLFLLNISCGVSGSEVETAPVAVEVHLFCFSECQSEPLDRSRWLERDPEFMVTHCVGDCNLSSS